MSDRYAVIGNPINHSKSPWIHHQFAKQTKQSICYDKILSPPDSFKENVDQFFKSGGKGLNVTLPFKEEAFCLCKNLSKRALSAQAVNTLWQNEKGDLCGDNTDGIGLVSALKNIHQQRLKGKNILIIGAGGATRGVLEPLINESPNKISIFNRTHSKAVNLALCFKAKLPIEAVTKKDITNKSFDIVINASSAGLTNKRIDLAKGIINHNTFCYDMIYNKELTPFLHYAKRHHAKTLADGKSMLLEQAAESFFIWRNTKPSTEDVLKNFSS